MAIAAQQLRLSKSMGIAANQKLTDIEIQADREEN